MTPADDADTPLPDSPEAAAPIKRRRAPRKAVVEAPAPTAGELVEATEAPSREALFAGAAEAPARRPRKPRRPAE
ncbi:MAG: hypothetical protein ACK5ZF_12890, partial [Betaproteobacteria bacterium]